MNYKIDNILKSEIDTVINFYKKKDFSSALDLINKLINDGNNFPYLLNLNGLICLSLNKWNDALLAFKKALNIDDKFIEAYNNIGVTYCHLGEFDKAITCYNKAINLDKNYANAYNNLATYYDDFGKYNEAIKNYDKALKSNPEHLNAKNNLIHLLNYYKTNKTKDNPILKANSEIQDINLNIFKNDEIITSNMCEFIKKCNAVIKLNSINFDYPESQIHRTNGKNLNCNRHKKIFNKYNIIPEYCFGCFKVQINFQKVSQLIKLFFIFDKLKLPNNNIRKCFIELRKNIKGNYKALIYCSNLDEAKKILNIINDILNKSLTNFILDIKRGCTEFNFSLPGYKDINKINEITYDNNWKNKEKLMDIEIENGSKKGKKFFSESLNTVSLGDILIINNWLTYAKIIGDESYKEISSDFIFSKNISMIIKNNLNEPNLN